MSRLAALLEEERELPNLAQFQLLLERVLEKSEANAGHVEVHFPYFVNKMAPVSGVQPLMDYEATAIGEVRDGHTKIRVRTLVPVASLCPCSKKISQHGAHNQRLYITTDTELTADIPVEAFIRVAEEGASCEPWGLFKHPNEKFATRRAYENPKSTKNPVRGIIMRLNQDDRTVAYTPGAENSESVHSHSACALVERNRRSDK